MLRFFYVDVHKENWSTDFVLWALFLSWYLDNTGITMWIGMCSLTSFTSSTWFSSSFFFCFLKIFWRTGIDSFTDIWFTLWTALKWLKWVFYSFVIHLVRYSVSSWVIFYSLCVYRSLYHWGYLFVGKVVHRISYLFYFSKVCSDFSFYSWTGDYIFSCLFVFPLISLVKNLSI